jgi:hypothetical protein
MQNDRLGGRNRLCGRCETNLGDCDDERIYLTLDVATQTGTINWIKIFALRPKDIQPADLIVRGDRAVCALLIHSSRIGRVKAFLLITR